MTAAAEIQEACPDCGAVVDEPHKDGCDVARCLFTGMQRLMCDGMHCRQGPPGCSTPVTCGQDIWSGTWPGEMECAEFGWWAFFRAPRPGEQYGVWEPCEPDHPDAVPDLNRLITDAAWDETAGRWVKSS